MTAPQVGAGVTPLPVQRPGTTRRTASRTRTAGPDDGTDLITVEGEQLTTAELARRYVESRQEAESLRQEHRAAVRTIRADVELRPLAGRAAQAAAAPRGHQLAHDRAVRGPGRGRQGRHDPAGHPLHEREALPGGRPRAPHRGPALPVVLPAVRGAVPAAAARSCCSTAAGTTARWSSRSSASAPTRSTTTSCAASTGFEKDLVRQGTILVKLYFSVTKAEQARRFARRLDDPLRQWKLSEVDMQAQDRWDDFTEREVPDAQADLHDGERRGRSSAPGTSSAPG